MLALLSDPTVFSPYVQGNESRPLTRESELLDNPDWSACFLYKNGKPVMPIAARCPATVNALKGVPLTYVAERSPSVLFSILRPGARIPPHTGLVNTRLVCHLPLIVPERCGFRVGNDVRSWVPGKAWIFDDTIEHEAWNESSQPRAILLFDIWRPELTAEERTSIVRLFQAIDSFEGVTPEWGI